RSCRLRVARGRLKVRREGNMNRVDWPRRRNGHRRRATAAQALKKGRFSRPTGWVLRVLVLVVVAAPALLLTSPGYVAFADKMPDVQKLSTQSLPTDTVLYASDGTTVLADLHGPGYQHYDEPLSAMGTLLPEALI